MGRPQTLIMPHAAVNARNEFGISGDNSDYKVSADGGDGGNDSEKRILFPDRESNVATRGASAIGESNSLAYMVPHEWSVFRMLTPTFRDDIIEDEEGYIKTACEETKAIIEVYPWLRVPGLRIVMVCAKEDSALSNPPAVEGLLVVHNYFMNKVERHFPNCSVRTTRMLVPIAHATSLIASNAIGTISKEFGCRIDVHLTDSTSVLSPDDVVLAVVGKTECVHRAIESLASHLREFRVPESLIPELKVQMNAPLLDHGISASGGESASRIPKRTSRTQNSHSVAIPLPYLRAIMGEEGANIKRIRESSSIIITIYDLHMGDLMGMLITSPSIPEIKKAEKLMQDIITEAGGPGSFFERPYGGRIGRCGAWYILFGLE